MKQDLATATKWHLQFFAQLLLDFPRKLLLSDIDKGFNENIFCREIDQTLLNGEIYKSEDPYSKFTAIFHEILHKHV